MVGLSDTGIKVEIGSWFLFCSCEVLDPFGILEQKFLVDEEDMHKFGEIRLKAA